MSGGAAPVEAEEQVVWHDVECGAYAEDLLLWEELAGAKGAPVLELGAGTGRVALHLAARGFEVHGLESDPALAAALRERAAERSAPVTVEVADVRVLRPASGAYPLVIGAMQLIQLLGGGEGRAAALDRARRALAPGGLAAFAIVEGVDDVVGDAGPGIVPDVRESDGWLHSSLPIGVAVANGRLEVHRLRQTVSPEGALSEREHVDRLDVIAAEGLEAEGRAAGLEPAGRRAIGESRLHVGSTVVLLRREP
jgi:SAM-dependent methyltransferase